MMAGCSPLPEAPCRVDELARYGVLIVMAGRRVPRPHVGCADGKGVAYPRRYSLPVFGSLLASATLGYCPALSTFDVHACGSRKAFCTGEAGSVGTPASLMRLSRMMKSFLGVMIGWTMVAAVMFLLLTGGSIP